MDDDNPKKRKPLTPRQQLTNVIDAVAEDALTDKKPLTKRERLAVERLREKLTKRAEDHDAKLDWEAGGSEWEKRAKKKPPPDSGYLM